MQAWAVRKYQKNINFWFGVDTYKKICQIYDYIVYHKIKKLNFVTSIRGKNVSITKVSQIQDSVEVLLVSQIN
jgi:hypothetical protein